MPKAIYIVWSRNGIEKWKFPSLGSSFWLSKLMHSMEKSCTNNNSKKPSYFPYSYNVQNNASVGTVDTIVDPSCENTEETLTKDCNAKSLKWKLSNESFPRSLFNLEVQPFTCHSTIFSQQSWAFICFRGNKGLY